MRPALSASAAIAMILPITDDLVLRVKARRVLLIPSWHRQHAFSTERGTPFST
jgi:hypothetical protein